MTDYYQLRPILPDSDHTPQGNQFMRDYLKAEQAADYLQVHKKTLNQYAREGRIPRYKFGGNIRYKATDLAEFIEKNRVIPDMNREAVKEVITK